MISEHEKLNTYKVFILKVIIGGGAPLAPNVHDFIRTTLNVTLAQGYGLTEVTGGNVQIVVEFRRILDLYIHMNILKSVYEIIYYVRPLKLLSNMAHLKFFNPKNHSPYFKYGVWPRTWPITFVAVLQNLKAFPIFKLKTAQLSTV